MEKLEAVLARNAQSEASLALRVCYVRCFCIGSDTFSSTFLLDTKERRVTANSIVINTGKLFSSTSGLLVNENSVDEYAAEKINVSTTKIICSRRASAFFRSSESLASELENRTATGAARMDNL